MCEDLIIFIISNHIQVLDVAENSIEPRAYIRAFSGKPKLFLSMYLIMKMHFEYVELCDLSWNPNWKRYDPVRDYMDWKAINKEVFTEFAPLLPAVHQILHGSSVDNKKFAAKLFQQPITPLRARIIAYNFKKSDTGFFTTYVNNLEYRG